MAKKKVDTNYIIAQAPVSKTIALLVIPALLGSIVGQINFILDTFFLSRVTYGSIEIFLAAVAAAFPLSLVLLAVANLFAIGGSIYGARALGAKNSIKARSIFSGTVYWGLVFNIVLIVFLLLSLNSTLTLLGAKDAQTLKYATDYALPMVVGSFTVILTFIFTMFIRSEGKAMLVLLAIAFQTVLNIILNYIFIIPLEMGPFGASLATVLSQGSQFLIMGVYLFSKRSEFQFYKNFKKSFSFKYDLVEVFKLGFPATLGIGLIVISSFILQYQVGRYEDVYLIAAIGVLIKFFTMFTMLTQAAASGIQPVFAYSYGAKNINRFKEVSKSYFKVSLFIGIIVGVFLIIRPAVFSNFLALDGDIAKYTNIGTIGIGVMLIFMPTSFLLQVLYQSINEPNTSMIIVLIRQIVVFLILTIIMNVLFGKTGILLAQQVSITIGSVLTIAIYYKKYTTLVHKKFNI